MRRSSTFAHFLENTGRAISHRHLLFGWSFGVPDQADTSIVSYATARPSSLPHILVRQEDARRWWDEYSSQYDLFGSQAVLDEASAGDPDAARERLRMLHGIPLIPITDDVQRIAAELLARHLLPAEASVDGLHVAAAAVGAVDYLLTLNCRHIANAHTLPRIYRTLGELGVAQPLICTPEEFFGDDDER